MSQTTLPNSSKLFQTNLWSAIAEEASPMSCADLVSSPEKDLCQCCSVSGHGSSLISYWPPSKKFTVFFQLKRFIALIDSQTMTVFFAYAAGSLWCRSCLAARCADDVTQFTGSTFWFSDVKNVAAKVEPTPQKKPKKPSTVSKKNASPRGKAKAVPKAKAKASTQAKGTRKSKASPKAKGKAAASRVAKSKAAPKKKAVAKKEKDSIQKKLHCAPGWQQVCETRIVKNCEQSFHFLSSESLAPDL